MRDGNPFRYCKGFGGIVEFIDQIWLRSTDTTKEWDAGCPDTMLKGKTDLEGRGEFTTPCNDLIEGDNSHMTNNFEQTIFIMLTRIVI